MVAFASTLNLLTHFTASLYHIYTLVIVYIIHPSSCEAIIIIIIMTNTHNQLGQPQTVGIHKKTKVDTWGTTSCLHAAVTKDFAWN